MRIITNERIDILSELFSPSTLYKRCRVHTNDAYYDYCCDSNIEFEKKTISNIVFKKCIFYGIFHVITFKYCTFENCKFYGLDLTNCCFDGCVFKDTTWESINEVNNTIVKNCYINKMTVNGVLRLTGNTVIEADNEISNFGLSRFCTAFRFLKSEFKTQSTVKLKIFNSLPPKEKTFIHFKGVPICKKLLKQRKIVGYKFVRHTTFDGHEKYAICELSIDPNDMVCINKRHRGRSNKAFVVDFYDFNTWKELPIEEAFSHLDKEFKYRKGEYVTIDDDEVFDPYPWNYCTTGIHFVEGKRAFKKYIKELIA